ncbi:hypothetical protein WA158_002839 [Blastocystis sp. Blastoise]
MNIFKVKKEKYATLYAGAVSGLVGTYSEVLLFPLDTMKTRSQAGSCVNSLKTHCKYYSGLLSDLMGSIPAACAYWCTYEYLKKRFIDEKQNSVSKRMIAYMCSGAIAEIASVSIRSPFEVIKQNMQIGAYTGLFESVRDIYNINGIASFYKGLKPMLFKNIPYSMIQFAIYETIKNEYKKKKNVPLVGLVPHLFMCIFTAFTCSLLTSPLDVIKTQIIINVKSSQFKNNSLLEATRYIHHIYGWKGFFLGIRYRLLISILASSTSIYCFQEFKNRVLLSE